MTEPCLMCQKEGNTRVHEDFILKALNLDYCADGKASGIAG